MTNTTLLTSASIPDFTSMTQGDLQRAISDLLILRARFRRSAKIYNQVCAAEITHSERAELDGKPDKAAQHQKKAHHASERAIHYGRQVLACTEAIRDAESYVETGGW